MAFRTALNAIGTFAWVAALCAFSQVARAAPESYDFEGYLVRSTVLDPAVPLPQFLVPCTCPPLIGAPRFVGTLVVDLALPPDQRVLELNVFGFTGETLAAQPGHPDNRVTSQSTADLGIGAQPPHWEIVTATARTGPLAAQGGRSIGMSLQWNGAPGAARQYPPGAQDADLGALTPKTSWRMNFTLSDASTVYANAVGTVHTMRRQGTGGPDFNEDFADGAAQGWTSRGGTWSAATGDLRNASNTAFTTSISNVPLPDEYVILTDVYLSWGASGNTAGVLFDYYGPNDFYELRLNAQGMVRLSQVAGGVRTTLLTGTYAGAGVRRWSTIYVRRAGQREDGTDLTIEINGQPAFSSGIGFGPDTQRGGTAGVFASWNLARFDNILIGAPIPGVGLQMTRFEDQAEWFQPRSGTWTIASGELRSSTVEAASIATAVDRYDYDVYGMSGKLSLEFSGAGNWGGFVYDYVDPQNYREVRLSLAVPGRPGMVVVTEVIGGLRREVYRAPRFRASTSRDLFLSISREGDLTIITELNSFMNVQLRQAPIEGLARAGLLAAWNRVRFDDVIVYQVLEQ